MRILLFLATNIAVMVLVSLVFNLLGLEGILSTNGVDLNLSSLLVFCALFGFLGSFVSLLASKYMAKRGTRAHIIEKPRNHEEQWLLDTVKSLSQEAGIGMPEVGVFPSDAA
ncbi:MAG: protease HtpX, partial [Luminiphilus sp.]|nr:protease HtpX [Luminiphilus sp.]